MKLLKDKILKYGKVLDNNILKVDSFINHQVDVQLMKEIGKEFKNRFSNVEVTKIITVEASGIAPAMFTAMEFGVDLVFAKKQKSLTLNDNLLTAEIFSYTKNEKVSITISKDYVKPGDKFLMIDDFLANGEVAQGLIEIIEKAGAEIVGIGIVIEKSYQKGRAQLDKAGYRTESLARISSLADHKVAFLEEN